MWHAFCVDQQPLYLCLSDVLSLRYRFLFCRFSVVTSLPACLPAPGNNNDNPNVGAVQVPPTGGSEVRRARDVRQVQHHAHCSAFPVTLASPPFCNTLLLWVATRRARFSRKGWRYEGGGGFRKQDRLKLRLSSSCMPDQVSSVVCCKFVWSAADPCAARDPERTLFSLDRFQIQATTRCWSTATRGSTARGALSDASEG